MPRGAPKSLKAAAEIFRKLSKATTLPGMSTEISFGPFVLDFVAASSFVMAIQSP